MGRPAKVLATDAEAAGRLSRMPVAAQKAVQEATLLKIRALRSALREDIKRIEQELADLDALERLAQARPDHEGGRE